jgi:hypothetical protein
MKKLICLFCCLYAKIATCQIVITELNYDTPYSEKASLTIKHHSGEYIELYNYTNEDIPLKGWFITDNAGKYDFPDDAIIRSEDFIIVAYRKNHSLNYFPQFFPNTIGQENKIFYQDKIIMYNTRDCINIHYGYIKDIIISPDDRIGVHSTDVRNISFQKCWKNENINGNWTGGDTVQQNFSEVSNGFDSTTLNNDYNYYEKESMHYNGNSNSLVNFHNGFVSPLSSNYLPPTQDLQTITQEIVHPHYDQFTWASNATKIINNQCPIAIPLETQEPSEVYLASGRCFVYDINGNAINSNSCVPSIINNPPPPLEYTAEQIAAFEASITIFPNPTMGNITINWDTILNGNIQTIGIGNVNGIHVTQQTITPIQTSTNIDISTQPMSIYIVKFTLNTGQYFSKNIIKL